MRRDRRMSFSELGVRNSRSLRALYKGGQWVAMVGLATDERGEGLTVAEVADYWKVHQATAYRLAKACEQCWPEWSPGEIWDVCRQGVSDRALDQATGQVMGTPVPQGWLVV